MKMKEELIGPTATIAAAMLSKLESQHTEFTPEIIASAFEDAYFALLDGIERVDKELEHRAKTATKRTTTGLAAKKTPARFTVR